MRRFSPSPSEACIAWYAACLSLLITLSTLLPTTALRVPAISAGMIGAALLAPSLVPRFGPLACVVLTGVSALVAVIALMNMAGLSLSSGRSASQAGSHLGLTSLFAAMVWCLAAGLVSAGRYIARLGREAGHLGERGYRRALALLGVAFVGFAVVGGMSVNHNRVFSVVHNVAAVTSIVPFWIGMALSVRRLGGLSRRFRGYSAIAAFAVLVPWLPTSLQFFKVIPVSPVSTLHMELIVFALTFIWLGGIAREWSRPAASVYAFLGVRYAGVAQAKDEDGPRWMNGMPDQLPRRAAEEDSR